MLLNTLPIKSFQQNSYKIPSGELKEKANMRLKGIINN